MTFRTKGKIKTGIAIVVLAIVLLVAAVVMQDIAWNGGCHSCGGSWIDNGVAMTRHGNDMVHYVYTCDTCGATLTTLFHH